jgi:hypothetical protein
MKVKNIGTLDVTVEGTALAAGEISTNIDDTLARQLVAQNPGNLALAPESEHTAEELADADKKKAEEEFQPVKGKTEKRPSTKTE